MTGTSKKKIPEYQRRFGAHVSVAGGLYLAYERAAELGFDCFQIFVKNQRQWQAKPMSADDLRLWNEAKAATTLSPVIAHDSYLINLAAPDNTILKKSKAAMVDELERCEALGIRHLVAHPGAHLGAGEEKGLNLIAKALDDIHKTTRGYEVKIALEATAGQGTTLGYRFAHLGSIIDQVHDPERLAVCVDTCHIFAAGYDLNSPQGYEDTIGQLDSCVGLDRLACVHVNNSLKPLDSRVDRHAHIGDGHIKPAGFKRLVNDARLGGIPMILETPKGTDDRGRDFDKINVARLRRMIEK